MAPIAGAGSGAGSTVSMSVVAASGTAGILITLGLIVCLSYLELLDASEYRNPGLRALLLSSFVLFAVTFASLVFYEVFYIVS